MKRIGISRADQRSRRRILRLIEERGRVSRAELARLTGLTRPTISSIVGGFMADEMVIESGKGASRGGKRPILLELNKNARFAVGIDLGDDYLVRGVLCDFRGNIAARAEIEYENRFESIVEALGQLVERLTRTVSREKTIGVGVAVSGIVDITRNEVINTRTFDIENKGLAARLRERCGFQVWLENRPNAAAVAENRFGAGRNYRVMVYITTGRGVGAGIVLDGRIFRGSYGVAGEIGETRVRVMKKNGEEEYRLLEELTRASAIRARAAEVKGRELTYGEVLKAYREGDADIVAIMEKNAEYLAAAARFVANLLNPEVIILGGPVVALGEAYLETFRRYFGSGLAKAASIGRPTEARYSELGPLGVAVGGAVIVLELAMELNI